jgi:hypothetical protein
MDGVIYYNSGTSYLVRLLVSLYSLRKYYSGPIMVLSDKNEISKEVSRCLKTDYLEVDLGSKKYLTKPQFNKYSPYENTLHIDSDTLILKDPSKLFNSISLHELVVPQFFNWTTKTGIIRRRIEQWQNICPEYVEYNLRNIFPAINCGIIGWSDKTTIFEEWSSLAQCGKNNFIPDEISLQLLLPYYPHKVISHDFNCSCKYDTITSDTYIIHYHGQKHCREGLPFNGALWHKTYSEILNQNIANIKDWFQTDRLLKDKK